MCRIVPRPMVGFHFQALASARDRRCYCTLIVSLAVTPWASIIDCIQDHQLFPFLSPFHYTRYHLIMETEGALQNWSTAVCSCGHCRSRCTNLQDSLSPRHAWMRSSTRWASHPNKAINHWFYWPSLRCAIPPFNLSIATSIATPHPGTPKSS